MQENIENKDMGMEWLKKRVKMGVAHKKIIDPHSLLRNILKMNNSKYLLRVTLTRFWFETALKYKQRILDTKIEGSPC